MNASSSPYAATPSTKQTASNSPDQPRQEKKCILCGQCLSVCPMFQATQHEELSPRAKLHTLRMAEHEKAFSQKGVHALLEQCLSCNRCEAICPQGLSVPRRLTALRAMNPSWQQRLWLYWIQHHNVLWRVVASFSKILPVAKRTAPHSLISNAIRATKALRAPQNPTPWMHCILPASTLTAHAIQESTQSVAQQPALLFSGCTARAIRPQWIQTATTLLTAAGYTLLDASAFQCCGGTLEHAGLTDASHTARKHTIECWRNAQYPLIVTLCASCYHALSQYPKDAMLDWSSDEQEQWLHCLTPLAKCCTTLHISLSSDALPHMLYHRPCHYTGNDPDAAWLRPLYGDAWKTPEKTLCCGMGGLTQLTAPQTVAIVNQAFWNNIAPQLADKKHCVQDDGTASPGAYLQKSLDSEKTEVKNKAEINNTPKVEQEPSSAQETSQESSYRTNSAHDANPPLPEATHGNTVSTPTIVSKDAPLPKKTAEIIILSGCSGCVLQLQSTAPRGIRVFHWLDCISFYHSDS